MPTAPPIGTSYGIQIVFWILSTVWMRNCEIQCESHEKEVVMKLIQGQIEENIELIGSFVSSKLIVDFDMTSNRPD